MTDPPPRRCDRCGRLTADLVEYVIEQMSRVAVVRWCADPAACRPASRTA
ncbi:hypothetical protein [Streptomyces sp. NPDC020983]